MSMTRQVLVIGGGGREHALAWKLCQSPQVSQVFVAPGNAGTSQLHKSSNVDLDCNDFQGVADWCKSNNISLVIVGPEVPLVNGIADVLTANGVACFGPSAKAAQLEASKDYAKQFMTRHGVPTAQYGSFVDASRAKDHINSCTYKAWVVKANGLAAGKGVVVAGSREEACQAACDILEKRTFGEAGSTVVIEELLEGEEVSCLAFCDGHSVACLPPTQDHKRLLDGDHGPNTGGMGAYCPYPKITAEQLQFIEKEVLQKTVDGLNSEGIKFVGILYAGVMLTADGPRVLEFNVRFGDPETQVILPLLTADLYDTCHACVAGTLSIHPPSFDPHLKSLGVVLVSGGYPGSFNKGFPITGLDNTTFDPRVTIFHAGTAATDQGEVITSGGRVALVLAVHTDFIGASDLVLHVAQGISFDGCFYRKDIGHHVMMSSPGLTYRDSGVDISAGSGLVEAIKPLAQRTARSGVTTGLGSFGAMFDPRAAGYTDPILVSGTDGVGTKLKISVACGCHRTVGTDLVAMCANDVLVHSAEPLFFLDYFATSKLDVTTTTEVIEGIAEGCRQAGCALVGGETAEMPGMYAPNDYDIAGFVVGAVERGQQLPRLDLIQPGDVVIGIASSGLHSNGFSLVRKVVERSRLGYDDAAPFDTSQTLGAALLTPTRIYVRSVLPLLRDGEVKSVCHITGGGLVENLPRSLPERVSVKLDAKTWAVPQIFSWLAQTGGICDDEMLRTFNCGLGLVLIVGVERSAVVVDRLNNAGETATVIGHVVENQGMRVEVVNFGEAISPKTWAAPLPMARRKRVGVLISGTGSNLQALIDHCQTPHSSAQIVLVISNKPGVQGLQRAQSANISAKVIRHGEFKSREEFDGRLDAVLREAGVELVCLSGFMRILSGDFVRKWGGRMLNTHPALLPSFKGAHAHRDVIASGVRVSGCTIHFVAEEVDSGAILVQDTCEVDPDDTEETLSEKVKKLEHAAYPNALELLASGRVKNEEGRLRWL